MKKLIPFLSILCLFLPSSTFANEPYAVTQSQTINNVAPEALHHRDTLSVTDNEGRRIEVRNNHTNNTYIVRINHEGHVATIVNSEQLGNNLPVYTMAWHDDALFIVHGRVLSAWHNDGRFHTILTTIPAYDDYYTNRLTFREGRVYVVTIAPVDTRARYVNWWDNYWYTWRDRSNEQVRYTSCDTIDFVNPNEYYYPTTLASVRSPYPVDIRMPDYMYADSTRCRGSVIYSDLNRGYDTDYDIRDYDYARKQRESQADPEKCEFYRTWYNDESFC